MPTDLSLSPASTALLVVDMQQKLVPAMQDGGAPCVANAARLLQGGHALGLRTLVTEQYPKGLGPTVPELAAHFGQATVHDKIAFAATGNGPTRGLLALWQSQGVRSVLVCGIEAHICVYQSVRGLAEMGFVVHVVSDACASRTADNHRIAQGLWRRCGAVVTSTEACLFDLLGQAHGDAFKLISRLIR